MALGTYPTGHLAGVSLNHRKVDPDFALGTTTTGDENSLWVYAQANGAVATGTCTLATGTWQLTDAAGQFTADTAFLDNEYGWVRMTADHAV